MAGANAVHDYDFDALGRIAAPSGAAGRTSYGDAEWQFAWFGP